MHFAGAVSEALNMRTTRKHFVLHCSFIHAICISNMSVCSLPPSLPLQNFPNAQNANFLHIILIIEICSLTRKMNSKELAINQSATDVHIQFDLFTIYFI